MRVIHGQTQEEIDRLTNWRVEMEVKHYFLYSKLCRSCVHRMERSESASNRCTAFPDGIPLLIGKGDIDHIEPIDGDDGIQYEPTQLQKRLNELDAQDTHDNTHFDNTNWEELSPKQLVDVTFSKGKPILNQEVTLKEVSVMLAISISETKHLLKNHQLPFRKNGGKYLIKFEDLISYKEIIDGFV